MTLVGASPATASELLCRVGGVDGPVFPALVTSSSPSAVTCAMPPVIGLAPRTVELTLNGQQYIGTTSSFTFHDPMHTATVIPAHGPTLGGTAVLVVIRNVSLSAIQLARLQPR